MKKAFLWILFIFILFSVIFITKFDLRADYLVGPSSPAVSINIREIGSNPNGAGTVIYHFENHSLVLTAEHVASKAGNFEACSFEECVNSIGIVASSKKYDIAIVLTERLHNTPATLSDTVYYGDRIHYIGSPLGLDKVMIRGYIAGFYDNGTLILDATCHPGSSGSGVFNDYGEQVGVVIFVMKTGLEVKLENGNTANLPTQTICFAADVTESLMDKMLEVAKEISLEYINENR